MAPEEKKAPEGKRTIVELGNGTRVQVMPGEVVPDGAKVVGSEPLDLDKASTKSVKESLDEVHTADVKSPKRSSRKSPTRKKG